MNILKSSSTFQSITIFIFDTNTFDLLTTQFKFYWNSILNFIQDLYQVCIPSRVIKSVYITKLNNSRVLQPTYESRLCYLQFCESKFYDRIWILYVPCGIYIRLNGQYHINCRYCYDYVINMYSRSFQLVNGLNYCVIFSNRLM